MIANKSWTDVRTPSVTVDLTCRQESVRQAREAVRSYVETYSPPAAGDARRVDDDADLLLVVRELVTNAHRYAEGPRQMRLEMSGGKLFIEVSDGSWSSPWGARVEERAAAGGFGLGSVLSLVEGWSTVCTSWGKRIQVVVPLSR
ncbi:MULTISPECIES: ATP-binding protein [unclassified Streptomyces]|uniref:ATP-binding protein n=1 Tax=unclassified Streptomyces TaxID=2593676 RepID=UPI00344F623F